MGRSAPRAAPPALAACTALAACAAFAAGDDPAPSGAPPGLAPLELAGRELIFDEPFDALDVSPYRERGEDSRWTAHTPWRGDFGDAVFTDPGPGFPFTVSDGVLRIEASRDEAGTWRSGLLTTGDPDGGGFAASTGYFEARMRLPPGEGVWPAFWLGSHGGPDGVAGEIDVVEFYGHSPSTYQAVWHVWKTDPDTGETSHPASDLVTLGPEHGLPEDLTADWHAWGVDVGDTDIVFYFDRRPVWSAPRPPEFDGIEFFPMVNLALGSGHPIENVPDPSYLYVDRVRVWAEADADDG